MFQKLAKITNTTIKKTYLRMYHGDIFSKEKLFRFGLMDSPSSVKCGGIENKLDLLSNCPLAKLV